MEFSIKQWTGIVGGWRKRTLLIGDNGYSIQKSKNSKHSLIFFSLNNANVIDTSSKSKGEDLQILIETSEYHNYLKTKDKNDKTTIIKKFNDIIKTLNSQSAFSKEYQKYKNEIAKQSQTNNPFDLITLRFTHFQNLFLEMNQKLDKLKHLTTKSKIDELIIVHSNLVTIKEEMKKQFDDLIEKVYDYHDLMEGKTPSSYTSDPPSSIANNEQQENDIDDISVSSDEQPTKPEHKYSFDIKDFNSPLYDFPKRSSLTKEIKCGNNMIKEFIKAMSAKKASLPIYFNEPISMLQKQCERFYYSDLLEKAAKETQREKQLLYISAFNIGEIFLNLGRFLKPFNPILGETYEYYDNEKHFRFFAEQVSHVPPISAFIGESDSFVMFGDTRATTSIKLLKGCLEVTFGNKTHLILKKTNEHYVFNKPSVLMKGLIRQQIYSDYVGEVVIQNALSSKCKSVITFYEGGKKPLGSFEGKIYDSEGEIKYFLGGNWKSEIYATDPDGSNKINLLSVDTNEQYMNNTPDSYVIPTYTCNLNAITDALKNNLPPCDSRLRQDLREYEEGSTEIAQGLKKKIEIKQNLRHQKFEEEKIQYIPHYFANEQNEISGDNVYMFNGKYWNDRKNGKLNEIKDADIFDIANINIIDNK